MSNKVVLIGAVPLDSTATLHGRSKNEQHRSTNSQQTIGGGLLKIARGLIKRHMEVAIVSLVGADAAGTQVREELDKDGIGITHIYTTAGTTTQEVICEHDNKKVLETSGMEKYNQEVPDLNIDPILQDCQCVFSDSTFPALAAAVIHAAEEHEIETSLLVTPNTDKSLFSSARILILNEVIREVILRTIGHAPSEFTDTMKPNQVLLLPESESSTHIYTADAAEPHIKITVHGEKKQELCVNTYVTELLTHADRKRLIGRIIRSVHSSFTEPISLSIRI